jgi:hypothetical protein
LTAADAARRDALVAYRAMWQDMVVAGRTADYESPALAYHASGDALSLLVKGLYNDKQSGVVIKGRLELNPQVTSLIPVDGPNEADIVDCSNDSRWLEYKLDGQLADNTPGGRRHVEAIVTKSGGVWRVDKLAVQAVGTCV